MMAAALLSGCYLSHERPSTPEAGVVDAGAQDGGSVTVPVGERCPPDYLRIGMALARAPRGGESPGTLAVTAHDGRLLYKDGPGGDFRFDLCVPEIEAPLDLNFLQGSGPNYILGVDTDIIGASWARSAPTALDWDQERFLERVFLARQHPESRFLVHLSSHVLVEVTESPSMLPCDGFFNRCWIRFIEVSPTGLLGGAAFQFRDLDHPDYEPGEMTLDASRSGLEEGRFEVRLPTTGLLADLPLTEVRPLDCSNDEVGPARPGELDLWRCTYAGVATIEETVDGVARGRFSYVSGPAIHADTLVARLGTADEGFEAHSFVPCCRGGAETEPITFGEVHTLEGGGPLHRDMWFRVDAPGYRHAFAFITPDASGQRFWSFPQNGQADVSADDLPRPFLDRHNTGPRPIDEMWVGAITTEGAPPWSAGTPTRMVRRRVIP